MNSHLLPAPSPHLMNTQLHLIHFLTCLMRLGLPSYLLLQPHHVSLVTMRGWFNLRILSGLYLLLPQCSPHFSRLKTASFMASIPLPSRLLPDKFPVYLLFKSMLQYQYLHEDFYTPLRLTCSFLYYKMCPDMEVTRWRTPVCGINESSVPVLL